MKNIINVIKLFCFFAILVFLFVLVQMILRPKDHSLHTMNEFYSQPVDSIDMILCGSSHMVYGVDANVVSNLTGMNTFGIAINGQKLSYTYEYVKEALKTQSPKVIVIDAFHFAKQNQEMPIVDLHYSADSLRWTWDKAIAITKISACEYWKELFFPIIRYHSRWNCLNREDFVYCIKKESRNNGNKGFRGLEKTAVQKPMIWNGSSSAVLSDEAAMYLNQFIRLSEQYNFKLVFLNLPFAELTPEIMARYNYLYRYLDKEGISYLDYNSNELLLIDYTMDFADSGHLNRNGASKISQDFSDWISDYIKNLQQKF